MSKVKKYFWLMLLCGLILVLVIILIVLNNAKNSYLNIYITPLSAKVVINGSEYENGVYKLFPGEYTAIISADGFKEKEVSFKLNSNEYTNLFNCLIENDSTDNYYEQTSRSDDLAVLPQIAHYNEKANNILAEITSLEKIYDNLPKPFKGDDYYYSIEKRNNCESILCLTIRNFNGNNIESAKKEIINMGFDPEEYQIVNIDGAGNTI